MPSGRQFLIGKKNLVGGRQGRLLLVPRNLTITMPLGSGQPRRGRFFGFPALLGRDRARCGPRVYVSAKQRFSN